MIMKNASSPDERPQRKLHRLIALLAAALSAAALVLTAAIPANATLSSSVCGSTVVIGVRGTGAAAGSGLTHNNRVWTSGGLGDQIDPLRQALYFKGPPYFVEALNYPASSFVYNDSLNAGISTLTAELNWLLTQCTYPPAVVLVGHSQGAQVISDTLTWTTNGRNSGVTNMVRAVILYGDPEYAPGKNYDAAGNGTGWGLYSSTSPAYNKDALSNYRVWGWPQGSTDPNPTWVQKVRSYCISGDFFCQSNPGDSNYAIHNSYAANFTAQAASFLEYMITSVS